MFMMYLRCGSVCVLDLLLKRVDSLPLQARRREVFPVPNERLHGDREAHQLCECVERIFLPSANS